MTDIISELRGSLGPSGGWKKRALGAMEANEEVRRLKKRVNTDPLTGLDGEYPLKDMVAGLQKHYSDEYKKGHYLKGSFIIMDLDGLHVTNRKFGKLMGGDDYLKAVGEVLIETAREKGGRCFRSGRASDEFVLYLPDIVLQEDLTDVLDRIDERLEVSERAHQSNYPGIKFGLSYCIASFHRAYGPTQAFNDANNRMGEAKESKQGERAGNIGRIFVNELNLENLRNE